MLIDTHTHFGICYRDRDGMDPSRWIEDLRSVGVGGAVMLGHRVLMGPTPDVPRANEELAELVQATRGFAVGLGTVHPFAGDDALSEAERCLQRLDMRGIKLHPWLQGFPTLFDPCIYRLCDCCADAGAPLLLHDGTPNISMPSQIGLLARRHPRTTFILGHGGLLHLWRQAAMTAATYDNVYITLCGPHPAALQHICRTVPTERILWGSDAGIGFVNYAGYRKGLMEQLDLAGDPHSAITHRNAEHLFGWSPLQAQHTDS